MLIITKEFLSEIFEKCVISTIQDAQQQVADVLPNRLIFRLQAFDQDKNKFSLNEIMPFLFRDKAFPRIVDIAVRGIVDHHTLIWIRPSGHDFVRDFSQTWNTPAGMGPFKSLGLMLPNEIWKRQRPYSFQDLIDAGKEEHKK